MSDPGPTLVPETLPLEHESEPFWSWIDVGLFVVGAPVVVAGVAILLFAVLKALHWPATTAVALLGMQAVLYVAAFALLWLILTVRHAADVWGALRLAVRPVTGLRLFLSGFALAFVAALLGVALHAPKIDNPVLKLMGDPVSVVAVVVFASTIGPAAEEVIFRGFLQPVATRTLGAAGGIAITSLVFSGLHGFEYRWCWQYLLVVFVASLAFGWTRLRWNSTGASTLLHAGYNLMFFVGYLLQGRILSTHG